MSDTDLRNWRRSLAAGLVVLGVVAMLLQLLVDTALQIRDSTASIWKTGKMIAGNTVHIPILNGVNRRLGEVSQAASGIAGSTERIRRVATAGTQKEG